MTYVQRFPQRFPQLPVPELSGRSLALLIVVSLHVLLVGLVVRELRHVPMPDSSVPPPIVLLPELSPPRVETVRPLAAAPAIEPVVIVPVVPELVIDRDEVAPVDPIDTRPLDPGAGIVADTAPDPRVLPRQDPANPLGRPDYPPMSVRLGESGVVVLDVCTDASGRTTDVRVRSSSGFGRLDRAAVNHLRRPSVRLLPGRENGVPVPMCAALRIRFGFDPD